MTRKKFSFASFVTEYGTKIFTLIAKYTSYVYAVSVFSVAFSGLVSTIFALYFFDAVNVQVSDTLMGILKFSLVVYWIIITIQHGILGRLGIDGFGRHFKVVNKFVKVNPRVRIVENLKDEEYKELFKSIVALPGFMAFNLFIWVVFLFIFFIMLSIFLEGFNGDVFISILTIGTIALFNSVCLTLIASEVMTGGIRERCKIQMHSKRIFFKDRALSTVYLKFIFFLILLAITLYLSNAVTYYNHDELNKVVSFAFLALLVSCLYAYMIFKIIYNALKQIESASYDLMRGGAGLIFPRSLDKEFINVAIGLNKASQTINDYKLSLEDKVKKRTEELNTANNELMEKDKNVKLELELARNIQQGIIPSQLREWNGISFATYYQPMGVVSGDYYDVFSFGKKLFVLIADVSGHGVPAAMITMAAKQAFSQIIREDKTPAAIFKEVNEIILNQVITSDYLSGFLLKIDENNRLLYANAAHPQAIHYISGRQEYQLLDTEGMFIGSIEEASEFYEDKELKLQSGDRIYLYTDGVFEHTNTAGEQFGLDRFIETLSHYHREPLQNQINLVIKNLHQFMGNAPITDDISMIAIELEPSWAKFTELYNAGIKRLRDKDLQDALTNFLDALKIIPSFLSLQFQISLVYYYLEDMGKALKHINIFLQENSTDRKGLQLAVNIYTKLDKTEEVEKLMAKINNLVD